MNISFFSYIFSFESCCIPLNHLSAKCCFCSLGLSQHHHVDDELDEAVVDGLASGDDEGFLEHIRKYLSGWLLITPSRDGEGVGGTAIDILWVGHDCVY